MAHHRRRSTNSGNGAVGGLFLLILAAWMIASWLTHVIVCIQTEAWLFLIAGAIMAPIGMIHGTGLWFGFF